MLRLTFSASSIRTPAALNASSCADLAASGSGLPERYSVQVRGESLGTGGVGLGRLDQRLQVLDLVSLDHQEIQLCLLGERTDVLDLIVTEVEDRQLGDLFERRTGL